MNRISMEHVMPVALGGDNRDLNLVAACQTCNHGKGARVYEEALQKAGVKRSEFPLLTRHVSSQRSCPVRVEDDSLFHRIKRLDLPDDCSVNDVGGYLILPIWEIDRSFAERVCRIMEHLGWDWYKTKTSDRFKRPEFRRTTSPPSPPHSLLSSPSAPGA